MPSESYGSYELIKRLATGGMAQIFLARPRGMEGFKGHLVVKRILPHLAENEDFIRMFLDEARIAARLNHPNIVQILDLGSQDDSYFIAMEHIAGEDLRRVTRRGEKQNLPLPVPLVCRIMMEACEGLDYAHRKKDPNGRPLGIVHRDISPQNIVVTYQGGVKLVDFGIAQAVDQATVTRSGVLKGKYSYMSPEQASALPVDSRSDIFALGVVLYELLTHKRLFKRANDIQTLNAVIECRVPRPSEVNAALPRELDEVVMRALQKKPEHRYAQAGQLKTALQGWLESTKQLPSREVLAQYMQRLYAERLAQEQIEQAAEEMDSAASQRKGKPLASQSRSRPQPPPTEPPDAQDAESTHAEPPEFPPFPVGRHTRDIPQHLPWDDPPQGTPANAAPRGWRTEDPTRTRMPTRVGSAAGSVGRAIRAAGQGVWRRRGLLLGLVLFASAGLGIREIVRRIPRAAAVPVSAPPAAPAVRVASEPMGAEIWVDGVGTPRRLTPGALPPLKPGPHTLELKKVGFVSVRLAFQVPEEGAWSLPVFRLEPRGETHPRPASGSRNVWSVSVEVESEPPGAELFVNGVGQGQTPQTFQASPRSVLALKLEHEGYAPLVRRIQVGDEGQQTERVELTPIRESARGPGE